MKLLYSQSHFINNNSFIRLESFVETTSPPNEAEMLCGLDPLTLMLKGYEDLQNIQALIYDVQRYFPFGKIDFPDEDSLDQIVPGAIDERMSSVFSSEVIAFLTKGTADALLMKEVASGNFLDSPKNTYEQFQSGSQNLKQQCETLIILRDMLNKGFGKLYSQSPVEDQQMINPAPIPEVRTGELVSNVIF